MPPTRPAPAPPPCERIERIEVDKSARRLIAFCTSGGRFEARAAMGRGGPGPKQRSGDKRTPEGTYHVIGPLGPSRFHGFVPFDYPSRHDAEQAFSEGRISAHDRDRIVSAHDRDEAPPGDTPLGGEIGLHGEGERWRGTSEHVDWTLGCVAVDDDALDFLADRLPVGTPVIVLP